MKILAQTTKTAKAFLNFVYTKSQLGEVCFSSNRTSIPKKQKKSEIYALWGSILKTNSQLWGGIWGQVARK